MATSFNVNVADLQFILKQIILAEDTSVAYTPDTATLSTLEAIRKYYGQDITVANAALLPFGLRTVDGSDNNLLPGQNLFGAADQLFPRLTDPVFVNEGDEPVVFGISNENYALPGSVVDADPRIISNLIVDMTASNPAAVEAALKYSVFSGAIAPEDAAAAATAIAQAYAATVSARAFASTATPANIAALAAIVLAEQGEQATAQTNYTNALNADTYRIPANLADLSDNAAASVVTAINAIGSTIFGATVGQEDLDNAAAAVNAANAALTAAQNVANALVGLTGEAAALTLVTNTTTLRDALLAYQTGLGSLGDPVDGTDLGAVLAAATAAAANLTGATALTNTLTPLVDPGGVVAAALIALNAANGELATAQTNHTAAVNALAAVAAADATLTNTLALYGIEVDPSGSLVIPNIAPDAGLTAPFNSWMTFFGQFFDHGLDLVTKGGNGIVLVPLTADDPLIAGGDGILGTIDDLPPQLRFMVLTRATVEVVNGVPQHENTTTSFIDQNQTYTSHASHQVFLREYARVDADTVVATGHLLEGSNATGGLDGAPANWAEVKAQALEMLGIQLRDIDVHNVPLLLTDQYGKFIPGPNGYAQMVLTSGTVIDGVFVNNVIEGTAAGITTEGALGTGHAFLNDIAHLAAPSGTQVGDDDTEIGNNDGLANTYDDELLDAHFITGDGRGNENIALTAVHSVFHAEHNRSVEANKATILASGDLAFINEWLRVDINSLADIGTITDASWDGERLFQAARFTTEMQYQHLVFEEFARRIQPDVDPFIFNPDATLDASILAEFAHTVYRFGHSMLTGTVDRLNNDLGTVDGGEQAKLLDAFLNPTMYMASGTTLNNEEILANIVRGTTRDQGNQIDEFIVQDLRSNLLGLPLDLAALNIARGRDTGIPSLNETRQQLHDAGVLHLTPYTSWVDFMNNGLNNKLSVVNFIAAYGTHQLIRDAATLAEKRAVALEIVLGVEADNITPSDITDRLDFLNATGIWAPDGALNPNDDTRGGLNLIDLWIGGLAEKRPEFGSAMLGQTFNYIFEYQMEHLQFGDRFYYLSRTQGTNFLNQLEPNTFADLVMRNSTLSGPYATHLSSALFLTPDFILELDRQIAQENYGGPDYNGILPGSDPDWDILPIVPGAKVTRDYSNTTTDINGHDVGGSIIFRGAEHTVIGGTEGNDYIRSDEGDDTLWGDGGNDHLISGDGVDNVFGGDGDDVIEDSEGAGDFLRGERGNDVIVSARGAFDVLFGGEGKDFIQVGLDVMEVFAGEGDDFVLGGAGSDVLMGNEGSDWIEGGAGFDGISGENSELFFNSPIIGHDVLFGGGDESDYDAESGDDIMVSAAGSVQRMEGMFGFDWGAAKYDASAVDFDLSKPFFTSDPADVLRDRFDLVEALSGWQHDDILTGDERGTLAGATVPGADLLFNNNVLDGEGINRIDGLGDLIAPALTEFGLVNTFRDGLMGKGGFDILDGDAWLNVRIKIVIPPGKTDAAGNPIPAGTYSAESLSTDTIVHGPHAGLVYNVFPEGGPNAGQPDFSSPAFGGRSLQSMLLDRTINPREMEIVREILNNNAWGQPQDNDVAVFRGSVADYTIEGLTTVNNVLTAEDVNGDGFISVFHSAPGGGLLNDDRDLVKNVEVLRFLNTGTVPAVPPVEVQVVPSLPQVTMTAVRQEGLPASGVAIGTLGIVNALGGATFSLQPGSTAPVIVDAATGVVTTTAALDPNSVYTLIVRATSILNPSTFLDQTITIQTGTPGDDNPLNGNDLVNVIYALGGNDVVNGLGGADSLFGQAGADILNGGSGNDALTGGAGADTVNGDDGNDTFNYRLGDGADTMEGGAGTDTLNITDVALNNGTLNVLFDGGLAEVAGGTIGTEFEIVNADLGDGVDTLSYLGSGSSVIVDLANETASGFTLLRNVENVIGDDLQDDVLIGSALANRLDGRSGADTIGGGDGDDTLIGGLDNDIINGGLGNDRIEYTIDDGADTVDGGADIDTFVISGDADSETLDVTYELTQGGPRITVAEGITLTNIEQVTANLAGAAADSLIYTSALDVTVNLGAGIGTASGFVSIGGALAIAGIENVTGGTGNDTITGNGVANVLIGGDGNDTLNGGAGADTLIGGLGQDTLNGDGGNDTFIATVDDLRDTITGGGGSDTADYSAYQTALSVNLSAAAPNNVVVGSGTTTATSDTLVSIENFIGGSGNDTITGSGNTATGVANVLNGGLGNDTLLATVDNVRDTLNGGDGVDTASYSAYTDALTVNLGAVTIEVVGSGTAGNTDLLQSIENFTGGSNSDTITGNAVDNVLIGLDGIDTLRGGGGVDTINAGFGSDIIYGGAGADIINTGGLDAGAGGNNGGGADRIRFEATGDYGDTITGFQVDANGNSDRFQFAVDLNTLFDDGINNNQISWISDVAGNNSNVVVSLNGTTEALFLDGANGIANADLLNTTAVATEFNDEFVITATDGETTLLVINDTDGTDAAVYQWVQAGGGEITANELTLIGFIDANGTVTMDLFGFV